MPAPVGRLAPTPSGSLHLGNALAFAAAWLSVRAKDGALLLRVEDVDTTRARAELEAGIRHDLDWLGLRHDRETTPQSRRDHRWALQQLAGHTYRCTCTRAQLREHGGVYPGTCRNRGHAEGAVRLRLPEGTVRFTDRVHGEVVVDPSSQFGDPVLVRKDGVVAYPLAVVADDIADGVTEVVRGRDLLEHTALQIRLYEALDATPPTWLHTPMVVDGQGRKLGKSRGSTGVTHLREVGWSAAKVWRTVLPWLGLPSVDRLEDAVPAWSERPIPRDDIVWDG